MKKTNKKGFTLIELLAVIAIIAIIIIFILVLILDKSQNTFNGQVLKIVGITEQKTEEAKEKQARSAAANHLLLLL